MCDKSNILLMTKTLNKMGVEENFLNIIKVTYYMHMKNIIITGEKLIDLP